MTWILMHLVTWCVRDDCVLRFFFLFNIKNVMSKNNLKPIECRFNTTLSLVLLVIFFVVFAEDNMTWIFWCSEFWDVWEMFVCSVFSLQNWWCMSKTKTITYLESAFATFVVIFFWFFFIFMIICRRHTWREYFDVLSFLRCERCLCAPFSFCLSFFYTQNSFFMHYRSSKYNNF